MTFNTEQAANYAHKFLKQHGEMSSEQLTLECKKAGYVPDDDRSFGSVYSRLSREGRIKFVGYAMRKRGHNTAGGRIWSAV